MSAALTAANAIGARAGVFVMRLYQKPGQSYFVFYRNHIAVARTTKEERVLSKMRELVRVE